MENLIILLVLFLSYSLIYSQDNTNLFNKGTSLKVNAPEGLTDKILGMGYDINFNELNYQVFKGKKIQQAKQLMKVIILK